jgi:hypothetical protein
MKETRYIFAEDVRTYCINKNLYTRGCCEEYSALLNFVRGLQNVTTEDIVHIATDIKDHSETGMSVSNICFEIARECRSSFEEE